MALPTAFQISILSVCSPPPDAVAGDCVIIMTLYSFSFLDL